MNPLTSMTIPIQNKCRKHLEYEVDPEIILRPLLLEHAPCILNNISKDICRNLSCENINNLNRAERYIHQGQSRECRRYGIWLAEKIFSGCVGYMLDDGTDPEFAYINYWVAVKYQKQGIAKCAVRRLLKILKSKGVSSVFAEVYQHNMPSQQCLLGTGFNRIEVRGSTWPTRILKFKRAI